MDRLYPNFYSLHATPPDPLEPRFKRRSWNSFPDNPLLPYNLYQPIQEPPLQLRRRQRCSSEAPTSRRVSTFLPDNVDVPCDTLDGEEMEEDGIEQANSISPIPPIAIVKPTFGRNDGRRIHRPQPCYGVSTSMSSNDLPPPCMQMSTPDVFFSNSGFKQPTSSLPRRRVQTRRGERQEPPSRHSVFEYPSVVDYGPVQNNDLTLRRRARRHPETISTAPMSRRRTCGIPTTTSPLMTTSAIMSSTQVMSSEDEQPVSRLPTSRTLPPICVRQERSRRNDRACLVANFEQSLAGMAQRLQSLTLSAAEKDSELRELRQIIDSMVQDRTINNSSSTTTTSENMDVNSAKPPFSPPVNVNVVNSNNNGNGMQAERDDDLTENSNNNGVPGTPHSSRMRKGGWLRSSLDKAFRRRGSQSSLAGDTSQSKPARQMPISAWNSPEHHSGPGHRKNFVRASSVSGDVNRTQGYSGNHLSNNFNSQENGSSNGGGAGGGGDGCCDGFARCRLLEAEVDTLRKELSERERRLTDAQLQALASAHQVDQLRDQLNLLFQQLSALRVDNEHLRASVAAAAPHFSGNQ